MGQRGQSWLAVLVLCMVLMLTPIIVGAQDEDDAEATPEATTEAVVDDGIAITNDTVDETAEDENAEEEHSEESSEDEDHSEDAEVAEDALTLFELRAVEAEETTDEEEPAGVGLLFFLLGIGAVGTVGMAMIGRENFNPNSES